MIYIPNALWYWCIPKFQVTINSTKLPAAFAVSSTTSITFIGKVLVVAVPESIATLELPVTVEPVLFTSFILLPIAVLPTGVTTSPPAVQETILNRAVGSSQT